MAQVVERLRDIVVRVNDYPYYGEEVWDKEKGIIRVYGRDGDKKKINRVIYPKSHYTVEYVQNNILPQYDNCPMCLIGKTIDTPSKLNFKYSKGNNYLQTIVNNLKNKKIKGKSSLFGNLSKFFKQPDVYGQGLAQIPKFGISLVTTELGNKVINSLIGAVGNIVNEYRFRRADLRALFTNMMFSFADPTATQLRELKRNAQDLGAGIKAADFSATFGSLIEEPQEVVGAIKALIPSSSGLGGFWRGVKGGSKYKSNLLASGIKEITPEITTKYEPFSDGLSVKDLVGY